MLLALLACTPCGTTAPTRHAWLLGGGSATITLLAEADGAPQGSATVSGATTGQLESGDGGPVGTAWIEAEEQDSPNGPVGLGYLHADGEIDLFDCGPVNVAIRMDVPEDVIGHENLTPRGSGEVEFSGVVSALSSDKYDSYRVAAPSWDQGNVEITGMQMQYRSGSDCLGTTDKETKLPPMTVKVTWALDPETATADVYECE